jgi:hypothetical protein
VADGGGADDGLTVRVAASAVKIEDDVEEESDILELSARDVFANCVSAHVLNKRASCKNRSNEIKIKINEQKVSCKNQSIEIKIKINEQKSIMQKSVK